jgi:hypothetical protein
MAGKFKGALKDMLQENGKTSQGRMYLLWSIISYYTILVVLTIAGLNTKIEIEMEKFKMIIDALEYAMTLFGSYVFGGKFITAYSAVKNKTNKDNDEFLGS